MPLSELIILFLACWAVRRVWLHGSIFSSWRARTQVWDSWLSELLNCPFCLGYHLAALTLLLFHLGPRLLEEHVGAVYADVVRLVRDWLALAGAMGLVWLLVERGHDEPNSRYEAKTDNADEEKGPESGD